MLEDMSKFKRPKIGEDLRTFPKRPIWMNQMEGHKGETIKMSILSRLLIGAILLAMIIYLCASCTAEGEFTDLTPEKPKTSRVENRSALDAEVGGFMLRSKEVAIRPHLDTVEIKCLMCNIRIDGVRYTSPGVYETKYGTKIEK